MMLADLTNLLERLQAADTVTLSRFDIKTREREEYTLTSAERLALLLVYLDGLRARRPNAEEVPA
jgi:hypothetical protein